MSERKKDGEQWLRRAVTRANTEAVKETLSASFELVSRIPGQVGELSGKAAGILTRQDAKSVRRRLTITAILVSIFAALVASVGNYLSISHSPEESTSRYFESLQKGDYLNGIDRTAYTFDSTYLTDVIYRAADDRVENYTITGTTLTGAGQASVSVLATIGDRKESLTLPLVQVPKTGPFNDTWVINRTTHANLHLTAPVALTNLTINGIDFVLPATRRADHAVGSSWNIPLLPGTYTIELPKNSYYKLAPTQQTIEAPLPDGHTQLKPLSLQLVPSPRMWEETNSLIEARLNRCESARRLNVLGCPTSEIYGEDSTARITDVTWKLTSRPAFYLEENPAVPGSWQAARTTPATFEVSYKADGKAQREIVPFYITAEVTSNGSQADILVDLGGNEESPEHIEETISSEKSTQSTLQKILASL